MMHLRYHHSGPRRRADIVDCDGFAGVAVGAVLTGMALLSRKDVTSS